MLKFLAKSEWKGDLWSKRVLRGPSLLPASLRCILPLLLLLCTTTIQTAQRHSCWPTKFQEGEEKWGEEEGWALAFGRWQLLPFVHGFHAWEGAPGRVVACEPFPEEQREPEGWQRAGAGPWHTGPDSALGCRGAHRSTWRAHVRGVSLAGGFARRWPAHLFRRALSWPLLISCDGGFAPGNPELSGYCWTKPPRSVSEKKLGCRVVTLVQSAEQQR